MTIWYMPVHLVCWLLFLHWLGDFKFQNNDMAMRKSKEWLPLAHHVARVTLTLGVGLLPFWGTIATPPYGLAKFLICNYVLHFVTDAVTSRINEKLWFIDFEPRPVGLVNGTLAVDGGNFRSFPYYARYNPGKRHWFFVSVGFDQWIHGVTLMVSACYWLR